MGQSKTTAIAGVSLSETGSTNTETFTVTAADNFGLLTATGTGVSGAGTKTLTITGTLAQVTAALATLVDNDNSTSNDTITLNATNSLGGQANPATIAITVNGAPAIAAPSTLSVGQGVATPVSNVSISESGNTATESFTVTVGDTNGLLSATGTGVTGSGTKSLTIAGSLTQVNNALATLSDTDGTAPSDTIALGVTDGFGNSSTKSIGVSVAQLTPVVTAPAAATVTQGTATAISNVTLAEPNSVSGETFTVTLSDTNGLLAATGTGVSGSGTKTLTIAGSLAQVNSDLGTLTDTDSVMAADTITVAATDSFGNAAANKSIAVTVGSALVPVITAPATAIVGVAQAGAITGISLAETGNTNGETFTVTLGDTNGLLSATGAAVSGSGTKALTITGSLAVVNAALATLTDTDSVVGADTITLAGSDSLGNTAATKTIAVTADGVPVITAPTAATIGVGKAIAVTGLSLSETGNNAGESFTLTLGDTNGLLSATGAGVSGSGTKTLTLAGTLAQVNADLATVTDNDATTPSDTITLNATDSFGNVAAAKSVAVTVNGVPVTAAPATAIAGVGKSLAIAGVSVSETGNTSSETFTVTLADSNGLLSATGTGITGSGTKSLTVTGTLAQVNAGLATLKDIDSTTGSDTITLATTDSFGNTATAASIAVTVNGLPVLSVPANAAVGVGQPIPVPGLSLAESGNTAGETFTVLLADTNGLLSATGPGVTGSGTTNLTIAGTLAQVNSALASVTDNDPTTPSDTITLTAVDSFGNQTAASTSVTVTVNGRPVIGSPAAAIIGVGKATLVDGVSLSESGTSTGETFTVNVSDSNGLLSATGAAVSGSGTKALTVTGSSSQVNAALATLTDTDSVAGTDTITLTALDSFGNSAPTTTIAVTVNGLPVVAAPATAVMGVGKALAIGGVSLSETGNTSGETFHRHGCRHQWPAIWLGHWGVWIGHEDADAGGHAGGHAGAGECRAGDVVGYR